VEERGLVGLKARATDGSVLGRILDVVTDDESGEVTHVVVEPDEGTQLEVPITDVTLDPEADFGLFDADPSDEEPGDHLGDEEAPQGYAPEQTDAPDDYEHEGQFVTTPQDPGEAVSPEEAEREAGEASGWEDEGSTSPDSGYPRNDVYIDPNTGEEELAPELEDSETLEDDVEDLLTDTDLAVRAAKDGVVELTGSASTQEDLDEAVQEIMGLDDVLDVDTTDVDVG
jgi:sporulation protein YlmC with PRC-barrel domain